MRRLLLTLAVLVAVLIAADFGLRFYTERRVGQELAVALDLSDRPSVSIGGFPFLVHFVAGDFPEASAEGMDLTVGRITVRDVRMQLKDIRFPPGDVLGGDRGTVRAGSGHGWVSLTGGQLSDALRGQGVPATVRIEGGEVTISSDELPEEVLASLSVSGQTLEVRSADPRLPASVTIGIPTFVEGLTLTDVEVRGATAVVTFDLDATTFEVG